ncbi:MAG: hypothetical protein IV104_16970 [Acidovorax sp.]|nr:hypothetical protein [Acidovorax sp.]
MSVRPHYLKTVETFEPFTKIVKSGISPAELKKSLVAVLDPYVRDKELLWRCAVSGLANEALCIANLNLRPEWRDLLVKSFEIRNTAISKAPTQAYQVICDFEKNIREAQRKYSMQILFEQSKEELKTDEYAFEMFRLIGSLIESTIQPFLKEIYCLAEINAGQPKNVQSVIDADFGQIIEQFNRLNCFPALLTPGSWGIRINQWRNIAQHHSFSVTGENIEATYGKSSPKKSISITRNELFSLSKELIRGLGALKSSRELTILNNIDQLRDRIAHFEVDIYSIATELAAAFATQGFTLIGLEESNDLVSASILDANPTQGNIRQIHCSQFVLPIGARFPQKGIEVTYESEGSTEKFKFSITPEANRVLGELQAPFERLADLLKWEKFE